MSPEAPDRHFFEAATNFLNELAAIAIVGLALLTTIMTRLHSIIRHPLVKKLRTKKTSPAMAVPSSAVKTTNGTDRTSRRIRMWTSFFTLAYLIFLAAGPTRKSPATVGDIAMIAMMAATYTVVMLDRT